MTFFFFFLLTQVESGFCYPHYHAPHRVNNYFLRNSFDATSMCSPIQKCRQRAHLEALKPYQILIYIGNHVNKHIKILRGSGSHSINLNVSFLTDSDLEAQLSFSHFGIVPSTGGTAVGPADQSSSVYFVRHNAPELLAVSIISSSLWAVT